MESEKLQGLLIDYIDGKLSAEERMEVEQQLKTNPEAKKLYAELQEVLGAIDHAADMEPGHRLQMQFESNLQDEMTGAKQSKQVFFQPSLMRIAAALALLISGIAIGFWINKNQQHEEELMALKKQVEENKQMMMAMLDNNQSASQRMMGVTVAFKMEKADDQILRVLAKTMNEDPNTNVRLAALEALGKFNQQDYVRKTLIASLSTQKDPIIQIALIRMMVEMKEKEAVKELQRISNDVMAMPAVKDEASAGILKLS